MLIKLSAGEVAIGKAIDFAVYSSDGTLLLREGHVVDSQGLLDRLYRIGHREGLAARSRGKSGGRTAPEHAPESERNTLLIGTGHLDRDPSESRPGPITPKPAPTLPNFRQQVEFFHLTGEGNAEAVRLELAGVIPDEALIARHARPDGPALATGTTYEARLFTGSRLFRFTTGLLPDGQAPLGCHFLRYPESVSQAIVRRHHRVATAIVAKLHTTEFRRPPTDVVVENMSSTGVGITTEEDFLTVGQSVELVMNLPVDNRARAISVVLDVRNRRQDGERYKFGLEIVQMSDEVRRDIKDFVLESVASI